MTGSSDIPLDPPDGPAPPWVGVMTSPSRVEAQLISATPFGRLRSAGRRVVEDVDGPMEFLPLPLERQLAGTARVPNETKAGQAWVETVANAIAKLTFGLRGGPPRVGLCIQATLDASGRRVKAAEGGARVRDFVESLEDALRGRNIDLATPIGRAVSVGEAATLGEMRSALGGLAGVPDALSLVWWDDVSWTRIARGRVIQSASEPRGGAHDLGLPALDELIKRRAPGGKRLFAGARQGDPVPCEELTRAAYALGLEAARRLIEWPIHDESLHPVPPPPASRLLVGGLVGRMASDPRLRPLLVDPLEEGLAQGLKDREDAALNRNLLVPDEAVSSEGPSLGNSAATLVLAPGLLQLSQEDSAAIIGAASTVGPDPSTP